MNTLWTTTSPVYITKENGKNTQETVKVTNDPMLDDVFQAYKSQLYSAVVAENNTPPHQIFTLT